MTVEIHLLGAYISVLFASMPTADIVIRLYSSFFIEEVGKRFFYDGIAGCPY